MYGFSHGYHGQQYCSWARTHDGENDDDGGVAQHGGHTPNIRLTETCSLGRFTVYFFDIGHPCWSIDTCQNKVSADQYQVTISRAQVFSSSSSLIFEVDRWFLIGLWIHVRLTWWKQGGIVQRPVNASPGFKFIRIITFSFIQLFFCCFVLSIWWL